MNSLLIGPGTSPPLTTLILSREILRLDILTFLAETCEELLIRTGSNMSQAEEVERTNERANERTISRAN